MEISLKKLGSQCEVLSREKENFEEENHNLRRQSQTLAKKNRQLLKENVEKKRRRKRQSTNLRTHQKTHTRRSHTVTNCGKLLRESSALIRHHVIHTGGKPDECNKHKPLRFWVKRSEASNLSAFEFSQIPPAFCISVFSLLLPKELILNCLSKSFSDWKTVCVESLQNTRVEIPPGNQIIGTVDRETASICDQSFSHNREFLKK
ncbi:hypothetical protein QTO34_005124 [Cnephaeus nilssonii]|uniref:C2H2-type domain-containing protein n=1 Tax=Cnephaeus nilssonii TaxID=3371016 RepID=A0AA40LJJ1_CNENI|nr:hypothetical protein QTO34_005124 [Eptesicus nilssonii]